MITKTITYTDYDDNARTEKFYFNLTKAELVKIEAEDGLSRRFKDIAGDNSDNLDDTEKLNPKAKDVVDLIEYIVSKSYGQKSEDGRRLIKSEELSKEFLQTEAYSQLFMDIAKDAETVSAFINGLMPKLDIESSKE